MPFLKHTGILFMDFSSTVSWFSLISRHNNDQIIISAVPKRQVKQLIRLSPSHLTTYACCKHPGTEMTGRLI